MIVDSHHHLWKLSRGDYGWLDSRKDPQLRPIERDFLLEEYRAIARSHDVACSVVVQAAPTLEETLWLLDQAQASDGLVRGVVGWIDMLATDAPDTLARLASNRLFRSVRPMLQDIADTDWVLQRQLDPAFRAMRELDLCWDVLIKPPILRNALTVLMRYPDLRAVIDHAAKPDIARGSWQPWAEHMKRVARETAAFCKLSGLVTEAGRNWNAETLRRYVDHLIECFGPSRLMWGSDWPVATLAADYARWLETAQALLATLSAPEREAVMGKNTIRFYRLAPP